MRRSRVLGLSRRGAEKRRRLALKCLNCCQGEQEGRFGVHTASGWLLCRYSRQRQRKAQGFSWLWSRQLGYRKILISHRKVPNWNQIQHLLASRSPMAETEPDHVKGQETTEDGFQFEPDRVSRPPEKHMKQRGDSEENT